MPDLKNITSMTWCSVRINLTKVDIIEKHNAADIIHKIPLILFLAKIFSSLIIIYHILLAVITKVVSFLPATFSLLII